MFEKRRNKSPKKNDWIDYWIHEPEDEDATTVFFLPGIFTTGKLYKDGAVRHLVDAGYKVILPEPHLGKSPIESVEGYTNLFMTLYYRLTKYEEMDFTNHHLLGYSLGSLVGTILAADKGDDHPHAKSLVSISPVVPGQDFDFEHYERQFFNMGTRLQFGREGLAGAAFAFRHGLGYMARAYSNKERAKRLLRSINQTKIGDGAVTQPTLAIASAEDEFFPPDVSIPFCQRTCENLEAHIVQNASHAEVLFQPDDIMRKVLDFYRQVEARDS